MENTKNDLDAAMQENSKLLIRVVLLESEIQQLERELIELMIKLKALG